MFFAFFCGWSAVAPHHPFFFAGALLNDLQPFIRPLSKVLVDVIALGVHSPWIRERTAPPLSSISLRITSSGPPLFLVGVHELYLVPVSCSMFWVCRFDRWWSKWKIVPRVRPEQLWCLLQYPPRSSQQLPSFLLRSWRYMVNDNNHEIADSNLQLYWPCQSNAPI